MSSLLLSNVARNHHKSFHAVICNRSWHLDMKQLLLSECQSLPILTRKTQLNRLFQAFKKAVLGQAWLKVIRDFILNLSEAGSVKLGKQFVHLLNFHVESSARLLHLREVLLTLQDVVVFLPSSISDSRTYIRTSLNRFRPSASS